MPLYVVTAPAGAGKTQFVIEQIRGHCETKALPRILVILPSGTQLIAFRERMGRLTPAIFGVTPTNFHSLYHDILDSAEALPRLMPESARYRVVRAVIRQLVIDKQLPYFASIADKPGFIATVSALLGDLKEGLTLPEKFKEIASTPRTDDLATIYLAYQTYLRENDLADREGMGWLAIAAFEANAHLYTDWDYIAADGFDEFNPTQLALLNLLSARVPRLDVTLTYQSNRPAHIRFSRTLEKFNSAIQVPLSLKVPPRAAPLEHLEQHLFELNAPQAQAQDTVVMLTAPDRVREVRAIARTVKQLLIEGVCANQIGVLFRRLDGYQTLAREIFTEFGVPFRVRAGLALSSNALVSALVNLLTLSTNDFPRRDTLEVLKAPYFAWRDFSPAEITQIEEITREAVVVKGRVAWLAAFVKSSEPLREEEEDTRLVTSLSQAEIDTLRGKIEIFLGRVTPPERGASKDFVAWIEGLIGSDPLAEKWQKDNFPNQFEEDSSSLRIVERARADDAPELAETAAWDVSALVELGNVLRGIVQAAEILQEGEIAWIDFVSDLLNAIDTAEYDLMPSTEGRVVISSITQTRGVPKDFIFLGGLIESEFPMRAPEDPLLTVREREMLNRAQVPLTSRQSRDETTLFYEAVTLARRKLFLSYPTLDNDANPLYPSPYLKAVNQVLTAQTETNLLLNYVPAPVESASLNELGVALTSPYAHHEPTDTLLAHALEDTSAVWRHSLFTRQVERRRESSSAHDEFSGVMQDPVLRNEFLQKFGQGYLWSASQFNEWGACGFRFFAKRLLNLKEVTEPEEGLDALQLGSLYHEILKQTYGEFAKRTLAVTPVTLEEAKTILQEITWPILTQAPTYFAFRPTAWWKEECGEILRRLLALVEAESERNGPDAPIPFDFEVPFGFKGKPALRIGLPVDSIRVIGAIDRIDRGSIGVTLVDYKSGSTPISSAEVIQGRNLQLPIYVLAAEAQGQHVTEAFFFHIRGGKTSGNLSRVDREGWVEAAKGHMNRYVSLARAGAFAVEPNQFDQGTCNAYCEFTSLCRVGRWSIKNQPMEPQASTVDHHH